MLPSVIVFDLDKTLALSKEPITGTMAHTLAHLLKRTRVAIISGGTLAQLVEQVANRLPPEANRANVFILSTSGAALAVWKDGSWQYVYEETLTGEEAARIRIAIEAGIEETGAIPPSTPSYGERIEMRGAQITLSALGQQAPIDEKEAWDPDRTKKTLLRDAIAKRLSDYDVKMGGSTSIDVTKHGVNKAYGVRKLSEYLAVPIPEMLYIGDALYPGGNDEVVKETGIITRDTTGPEETERIIETLLA
jgi:phosphomannomutase